MASAVFIQHRDPADVLKEDLGSFPLSLAKYHDQFIGEEPRNMPVVNHGVTRCSFTELHGVQLNSVKLRVILCVTLW